MTRISISVIFLAVLCCVVLVTEGRSTKLALSDLEQLPTEVVFVNESDDSSADTEDARFFSSSTGTATATAINNLITQEIQTLERLRPSSSSSSSSASNVYYVNAASGTTSSTSSSSIANALIPQVIAAAGRRRRRPGNRNRNRNRNGSRGSGKPQVFLVRP